MNENALLSHDQNIRELYQQLRPLLLPPTDPPSKSIGFSVRERGAKYSTKNSALDPNDISKNMRKRAEIRSENERYIAQPCRVRSQNESAAGESRHTRTTTRRSFSTKTIPRMARYH